ncbi:MAG: hypothetical protein ACRDFX_09050 [Chloroflexota bacterium]
MRPARQEAQKRGTGASMGALVLDDLEDLETHVRLADIQPEAALLLLAFIRELRADYVEPSAA